LAISTDFSSNDDLIPGKEFEAFTEDGLGLGIAVKGRGIEEIDASIESCLNRGDALPLVNSLKEKWGRERGAEVRLG
jgi:hypothetical protein